MITPAGSPLDPDVSLRQAASRISARPGSQVIDSARRVGLARIASESQRQAAPSRLAMRVCSPGGRPASSKSTQEPDRRRARKAARKPAPELTRRATIVPWLRSRDANSLRHTRPNSRARSASADRVQRHSGPIAAVASGFSSANRRKREVSGSMPGRIRPEWVVL